MTAFVDLAVLGSPEALGRFFPAVESLLPSSAYRDLETEQSIRKSDPDSHCRIIRWQRFSDDLMFPIEQYPEAISFQEVMLSPGRIVPPPGFPPLLADFYYRFVKPVTEQLGLKPYSTAFEDTPPQFLKRRPNEIERALGWSVARQLFIEGYRGPFRVPYDSADEQSSDSSVSSRLLKIHRLCRN